MAGIGNSIYEDLDEYDFTIKDQALTALKEEFNQKFTDLQTEIETKSTKIAELEERNQILQTNISHLYATCRNELTTKNKTIVDLRRQLDNISFRRRKNDEQQLTRKRNYPDHDIVNNEEPRSKRFKPDNSDQNSFVEDTEHTQNGRQSRSPSRKIGGDSKDVHSDDVLDMDLLEINTDYTFENSNEGKSSELKTTEENMKSAHNGKTLYSQRKARKFDDSKSQCVVNENESVEKSNATKKPGIANENRIDSLKEKLDSNLKEDVNTSQSTNSYVTNYSKSGPHTPEPEETNDIGHLRDHRLQWDTHSSNPSINRRHYRNEHYLDDNRSNDYKKHKSRNKMTVNCKSDKNSRNSRSNSPNSLDQEEWHQNGRSISPDDYKSRRYHDRKFSKDIRNAQSIERKRSLNSINTTRDGNPDVDDRLSDENVPKGRPVSPKNHRYSREHNRKLSKDIFNVRSNDRRRPSPPFDNKHRYKYSSNRNDGGHYHQGRIRLRSPNFDKHKRHYDKRSIWRGTEKYDSSRHSRNFHRKEFPHSNRSHKSYENSNKFENRSPIGAKNRSLSRNSKPADTHHNSDQDSLDNYCSQQEYTVLDQDFASESDTLSYNNYNDSNLVDSNFVKMIKSSIDLSPTKSDLINKAIERMAYEDDSDDENKSNNCVTTENHKEPIENDLCEYTVVSISKNQTIELPNNDNHSVDDNQKSYNGSLPDDLLENTEHLQGTNISSSENNIPYKMQEIEFDEPPLHEREDKSIKYAALNDRVEKNSGVLENIKKSKELLNSSSLDKDLDLSEAIKEVVDSQKISEPKPKSSSPKKSISKKDRTKQKKPRDEIISQDLNSENDALTIMADKTKSKKSSSEKSGKTRTKRESSKKRNSTLPLQVLENTVPDGNPKEIDAAAQKNKREKNSKTKQKTEDIAKLCKTDNSADITRPTSAICNQDNVTVSVNEKNSPSKKSKRMQIQDKEEGELSNSSLNLSAEFAELFGTDTSNEEIPNSKPNILIQEVEIRAENSVINIPDITIVRMNSDTVHCLEGDKEIDPLDDVLLKLECLENTTDSNKKSEQKPKKPRLSSNCQRTMKKRKSHQSTLKPIAELVETNVLEMDPPKRNETEKSVVVHPQQFKSNSHGKDLPKPVNNIKSCNVPETTILAEVPNNLVTPPKSSNACSKSAPKVNEKPPSSSDLSYISSPRQTVSESVSDCLPGESVSPPTTIAAAATGNDGTSPQTPTGSSVQKCRNNHLIYSKEVINENTIRIKARRRLPRK